MAYEQKDNTGAAFTNRKKESERHPDFTGNAMIGGVEYWVSTWVKQDKNGKPYHSHSFRLKDAAAPAGKATPAKAAPADLDDTIPF